MLGRKVGLLNSEGYGSCQFCGHPYPPEQLYWFEGRRVCRFHLRRHTYAFLLADVAQKLAHAGRYVHIQGMLPVDAEGEPVSPPTTGGAGGGAGGGSGDNTGGGTDPGTGTDPGEPSTPDPTANYIDGSCN